MTAYEVSVLNLFHFMFVILIFKYSIRGNLIIRSIGILFKKERRNILFKHLCIFFMKVLWFHPDIVLIYLAIVKLNHAKLENYGQSTHFIFTKWTDLVTQGGRSHYYLDNFVYT